MAIKNKQGSNPLTHDDFAYNEQQQQLYNFVNSMLRGRLFMGDFQEKRYVANLQQYRDVIVINGAEKDLHVDLEVVKKRLSNTFKNKWIGITTPRTIGAPAGYCIWVDLPAEVFGTYWYKIRSVSFRDNEILLKIKPVRAISFNTSSESNVADETVHSSKNTDSTNTKSFNIAIEHFLHHLLTWENIKETSKFLILLTGTILVGLVEGAKYLAEYGLKLAHELSNLIRALTPFAIACVGMCEKIVGGFYILLAMIFRDFRKPQHYQAVITAPTNPMLTYRPVRNRFHNSSVRIQELR